MTWKPLPGTEPPDAMSITESLSKISSRLKMASPQQIDAVFTDWSGVVGAQLAGKCRPLSLVDEVLTVEAIDNRWGAQLKWLAPQLVNKVNEAAASDVIQRIEVRISAAKPDK